MQGEGGGGALDFSFIFKSVCDGVRMYFILLCERGGGGTTATENAVNNSFWILFK